MNAQVEWAALFVVCALVTSVFDRFEVETAAWRKCARWALAAGLTVGTTPALGHWSLAVLGGFAAIGGCMHWWWCTRHGIDPLRATPRRRYYELRGWTWPS